MNPLTQALISGVMSGAVYALLATGLVLAFHTSRVLNLAHGEAYTVGGIVVAMLLALEWPMAPVLALGIAAATVYAVGIDQLLLKPRRAGRSRP